MTRAIVNVSTGDHYQRGQSRLVYAASCELKETVLAWGKEPSGCPPHSQVPYAFKGYALKAVADKGYDLLLWCDASILPIRSLEPLWERIERDGYWMSNNGFTNYEWTADSAYEELFIPEVMNGCGISELRYLNEQIPHVVATAFGLNVRHPKGRAFLDEYYRLASETKAFCGPWKNSNAPGAPPADGRICAPCGPPDVRGHRHDQTAASVIAWRLGFELTNPPEIIAYRGGETEKTILVADGGF